MAVIVMCVVALLLRFVPHMPNAVPMAAMALYAGAFMDKRFAAWLPLALYAATDVVVGMHDVVPFTWGSILLITLLGTGLRGMTKRGAFAGTLAGTLAFFAISNFGVWLVGFDPVVATKMYPLTLGGLIACYTAALPFLLNSLVANMVFIAALMAVRGTVTASVKEEQTRFALLLG